DRAEAGRDAQKQAAAAGDELFEIEYRIRHANGNWVRVRDSGRVVERSSSGIPIRIVGVLADITGEWLAKQQVAAGAERLALATQAAGIGVWERDFCSNRSYWDSRMREIYAVPADLPDEELSLEWMTSRCHPDDLPILKKMNRETMAGANTAAVEFRIIRPDGTHRHLDMRGLVYRDHDGKPIRMIGITMDMTERNHLLQERQTGQRLESIGQLAAGIAHEINTPTQYIGDNTGFLKDGFGQLLELLDRVRTEPPPTAAELQAAWKAADADYLREEIPRAIEQSLEGIKRVSGIVRAMKEFSHPATERSPHDLNRAIQSTVMVASNEWKYVAELATDLDPALPAVPVMPGEFNQVILNMVVNAAHAIAAVPGHDGTTKGRISITTRLDGDQAVIILSDSGCGMPDEVKKRIFEPFFTTKEVGRGTGQGLAITHNFVTRHNGTINVDSAPGKGTTFTLRLPISVEEIPAQVA
ncbi:MAG: PAS domain-containing protein, partial [Gammaproteobacteria bacterium]|nr:PAS domain-containing protein [Gammaproteobacteria bacterium]